MSGAGSDATAADAGTVTIDLEHGRWGHGTWALFGVLAGALLIWRLDVVGKGAGVLLVLFGLSHLARFVATLRHPAGTIEVGDEAIQLPRGLCRAGRIALRPAEIENAYFLRRAVPFVASGPVLVIEAAGRLHLFPRDWFASDADQRRIAHALNRRLGRTP